MSRKAGWIEAVAVGATLTGSAGAQESSGGPPEGVDYLMAMQCAALNLAHYDITLNNSSLMNGRTFQNWARARALQANPASLGAAEKDIEASRADVLAGVGPGEVPVRRAAMETQHAAELKVCDSFIDNAVIRVIVGG